jgi:hypothetical protein
MSNFRKKRCCPLLKSLDLQTVVTRAVDVQRMQQIQNTRPHIEQQQFSQELKHQFERDQTKVAQTTASQEDEKVQNHFFEDSSQQSTRHYRRFFGKKQPKPQEEQGPTVENGPGQHLDIKI